MPDTMAQVKVPYVDHDNQSAVVYSDDFLFLPAEKEVSGTPYYSPTAEGDALTQFAYYKNGGNTVKNFSGSVVRWWLRSVAYNVNDLFCCVDVAGFGSRRVASYS